MERSARLCVVGWVAVAIVMVACESSNNPFDGGVSSGGSKPPVNYSITVEPAEIDGGGQATVAVTATDPEGQGVVFAFTAQNGTVTPDPEVIGRATYKHDGSSGPATVSIRVTVTDTTGASVTASKGLQVKAPAPPSWPAGDRLN